MKRKTKIMISALSVMFVAAIAVAIASFSFAGDGDDALQEDTQYVASAGEIMGTDTIIDYIIENSHSTEEGVDPIYHIAEITSSTPSTLKNYVESDAFKNYVIDGHRTIEQAMAEGCVEYKSFKCDVTDEDSLKYISKADFIYVSNDSANKFSVTNDMSEDLYDILHEYAVGSFKPIVIDSPVATSVDDSTSKSTTELAKKVFGPNEKYYYTFSWKDSLTAEAFLSHAQGSLYLGINGQTQKENGVWTSVAETNPSEAGYTAPTDPISMAKILTITNGTADRTTGLLAGCTEYAGTLYDANQGNALDTTGSKVYVLEADSIMYLKGYNNRVGIRPKYIQNDTVSLADSETVDFDQYDMIILEDSCIGQSISVALYKKFAAAMYGKLHIVYSEQMGTGQEQQITDTDNKRETNYLDLFYMVATADYTARYENVMVTNRNDFSIITTSESVSTAKVIADLINASTYRGIGGSSSASSMFTVLEIQPCYPIDTDVAQALSVIKPRSNQSTDKFGSKFVQLYSGNESNYYTVPADMVNGKTKEQLPKNTEYYDWELSKAKLSEALGVPYNKINLVQMSTEEFAGDKTEILGTYDLVYIGGNTTALKDSVDQYQFMNNQFIRQNNYKLSSLNELPIYTMYSHNGDMVRLTAPPNQNFSGGSDLTAAVKKNGANQSTFTYLNGNDITYNRYLELKNYIDKGMPVVISKKLTAAYNYVKQMEANGNIYLQNSIDPDSNMYKVLVACEAQTRRTESTGNVNSGTVVWNFDQDAVVSIISDGTYGDTQTGYVSVFASENGSVDDETGTTVNGTRELLNKVYRRASKRPKLIVKSMPTTYNRFDPTTRLTERKLSFSYDVSNSASYTVSLYVDNDGNSKFDRSTSGDEYKASSKTNTLTYQCPESFFGPVYWMIEVVDDATGIAVNQTGFSYIKNKENKKQEVSVLQIMPEGGGDVRGNDSLYFCTVCQRSSKILEYNPYMEGSEDRGSYMAYYGGKYIDSAPVNGNFTQEVYDWVWDPVTQQTNKVLKSRREIYIGKHEHVFGINSYDSNITIGSYTGLDNFDVNLADEISDLYDFNIDIVRSREFEQMAQQAHDAYVYVVDENGNITNTVVSLAEKRAQVKTGPNASAPNYEDFRLLKESLLDPDSTLTEAQQIDALSEDDINLLYVMKKKCDYAEKAAEYQVNYETQRDEVTAEAKEKLDAVLDDMIANSTTLSNDLNGWITLDGWKSELQHVKNTGYYFDYYLIGKRITYQKDISSYYLRNSTNGSEIDSFISAYYHAKDLEMEYKDAYKFYTRLAAGSEWIESCYSTVVLGPSEGFNGDDIKTDYALDDLATYLESENQVVLFHDTLTFFNDKGAAKLTNRLRPYFGMDRYHMQTAAESGNNSSNPVVTDAESSYVKYTSTDSDRYFMTELSYKGKEDDTRYASWASDMELGNPGYLTDVAYTDSFNVAAESSGNLYAMPYKYAELDYSDATVAIQDVQFDIFKFGNKYGTNKVSQNNQGIVTTFPFTIAKELNVGPTHGQAYAVDLEDDDMTVWYSLAGGNSAKLGSSLYAATPRDAMDNYFLYSYKNVFYCGAGHSDITGVHKDNNDERYLFINILCNSVRLSMNQPRINVFDYDETETKENNTIVKPNGNDGYVMKVKEDTTYPEFNLKVVTDNGATLSKVKIYYDLDYKDGNTDNAYMNNANHVLIADWDSTKIISGQNKRVFRYDASLEKLLDSTGHQIKETYVDASGRTIEVAATSLRLKPEYFAPYNNEYTYIVIEATDSKGQKVYQRIKIQMVPHLFDLT